jgi:hypothetical protein
MRSICCPLFCVLAVFFFVLYLTQTRLHPDPNEELLLSLALTGVIAWTLYGLYRFIRRLHPNRALWRIIYGLIGLLILLLIISIPELRQIIQGWIAGISAKGENPIVLSVLCLIYLRAVLYATDTTTQLVTRGLCQADHPSFMQKHESPRI